MSLFAERILLLLSKNGLTQKEFAKRINVTPATLCRYISDERIPNGETVANMATALHTTSDYLLGLESDEDYDFPKVERLIARNASKMTTQQKRDLINALFGED